MSEIQHWPVVVVGAGPTGLTVANLLARYGVNVLLIERNPSTVAEPRAVSIDDESMRTMQAIGIADTVFSQVVPGYGSDYYSTSGKCFLKVHPDTREYGYPRRNAFRQPVLEAQLRDHLLEQINAQAWFSSELTGFEQNAGRVLLHIRRGDGSHAQVSCGYVAACDGSKSLIREQLRIPMSGSTFRERWLIVDLEQTNFPGRDTRVFCNPERPCIALPGPHKTRRFEFMLHEGESEESVTTDQFVTRLLKLYSDDDACPIRRKAVYTFHARLAQRWSEGRIFLAGDAAHLSPPFAGQGMNSGIRDAHNLAWKLAAVVQGRLGPGLLQTYEQERRRHVWDMIRLALRMGRVMMPRSRWSAFAMERGFRMLGLYPPARDYFAQMKYKPKPRFASGLLLKDPRVKAIGSLFPQPEVAAGSSRAVLLDEILGDGFALVAPPGTSPRIFEQLPEDFLSRLEARRVAIAAPGDPTDAPDSVRMVVDSGGELKRRLAGLPPGLLVLRPDRYVAAFLDAHRLAFAAREFEEMVSRTCGNPSPKWTAE